MKVKVVILLIVALLCASGCKKAPKIYSVSLSTSPETGGVVTGVGTYQEGENCTLTAMANENYVFYYWSEDNVWVSSDAVYSFTVDRDRNLVAHFVMFSCDGHAYIDLGLPSGMLWATCNVGANTPEEYGDYFAWGEIQPKDIYSLSNYQYSSGNLNKLSKYCNDSEYGDNGFTDDLTVLMPEDDAAVANWGEGWRMPTREEWNELLNNTTHAWTTQNGVKGRLFTASNGEKIFLPAAGYYWADTFCDAGGSSYYWSSMLDTDYPYDAWNFYFSYSGHYCVGSSHRFCGQSIRAVRSAPLN